MLKDMQNIWGKVLSGAGHQSGVDPYRLIAPKGDNKHLTGRKQCLYDDLSP